MHKNTVPHTLMYVHTTLKYSYTNTLLGHEYILISIRLEPQQILLIAQMHMQIFAIIPIQMHLLIHVVTSTHTHSESLRYSFIDFNQTLVQNTSTFRYSQMHTLTKPPTQIHTHRSSILRTQTPHSTDPQTHNTHLCASNTHWIST